MCTVDKCPPQLWLLFCCCPVAREQRVCFLQDRVRDKLLIGRSSGLCNNLLIQKHEPCQVVLNKWLLYCAEEKASFTACLYFSSTWPALLEREAALLSSVTLKCLFRIKHGLTWPCLSRSTTVPVNPVRAAVQGRRLAPAGLVLIQVHILKRTWTNDQILYGINIQARLFNQ